MRTIFVLTLSPSGENVNTNMALIHRQVKGETYHSTLNDMGPNDSLTNDLKEYISTEKYYNQQ